MSIFDEGRSSVVLIMGGVSSGKSLYAERMIEDFHDTENTEFFYFTPADNPRDDEMRAKVAAHRSRRPGWLHTVECGAEPVKYLEGVQHGNVILFDSAGTLLGRLLMDSEPVEKAGRCLFDFIDKARGKGLMVIIVSEEVGMSLVPISGAGRIFQKTMGDLNRMIAAEADEVFFITAGIPQKLK